MPTEERERIQYEWSNDNIQVGSAAALWDHCCPAFC
jgi:hypothetical protein